MLTNLELQNFKCFKEAKFKLGTLTMLTGANGTGKSTVIQALLAARQTGTHESLQLNGSLVELGRPGDVFCDQAESEDLTIRIDTASKTFEWKNRFIVGEPEFVQRGSSPVVDDIVCLFSDDFHYLSAERWGPRVAMPLSDEYARKHQLGRYGEYSIQFLVAHGDRRIPNEDLATHEMAPKSRTLIQQTQAWLGELCPGVRIDARSIREADIGLISYSFADAHEALSSPHRPTNVAFGLSFTLPVIVALLSLPKGGLVLLENPEAHLHPRAQTRIGKLIALAASAGIQVIVETHSEHVFNGIRLAVKNEQLSANDACLYYFSRDQNRIRVDSPILKSNGKVDSWPDGFFDEAAYSLASLAQ